MKNQYLGFTISFNNNGYLCLSKDGKIYGRVRAVFATVDALLELKRAAIAYYILNHSALQKIAASKILGFEGIENEYVILCEQIAKDGFPIPEEISSGIGEDGNWYIYFNNHPLNKRNHGTIL